jgi:hypothetical protein
MILGALTYSLFNLAIFLIFINANVAANWIVIMTMSAVNGYGSGLYWVAQGTYMSITIPEDVRSYYMGVFYGLLMLSGVVGGFLTALMFEMISTGVVVAVLGLI